MQQTSRSDIIAALDGDALAKRLARARRFEDISGGGTGKQLERLIRFPSIYIPYLLHVKAGLSRYKTVTAILNWGRSIRIPMDDYDAFTLYLYGGLYGEELKLAKYIINNLNADDVFYDIGANRGFYTYLAAELCKEIHTFEPLPKLAAAIKKNVRTGDVITVNAGALSDTVGTITFYVTDSTMVNTIDKEVAERYVSLKHSRLTQITVPTTMLDEYIKTHAAPTFLKIDAEGAEGRIIDGGRGFFSSHSPTISLEVWSADNNGTVSMQAVEKLRALGYASLHIHDDGTASEVTGDLSMLAPAHGADNFIFRKAH